MHRRMHSRVPRGHEQVPGELELRRGRRPCGRHRTTLAIAIVASAWVGAASRVLASPPLFGFLPRFLLFVSAQ